MNSEERRAARRKRREEKRARKRAERLENCTLENVADLDNLFDAAREASAGVNWKSSTQRYMQDQLRNVAKARRDLLAGVDTSRGFVRFSIYERGKRRDISAVHFSERPIQKSLTKNALIPAIEPTLVNGNTANRKGMGTHYAVKLLKKQLARHYRKHGTEGYILQVDFADYFASIEHESMKELVRKSLDDPRIIDMACKLIDAQGDVGLGLGSEPNQVLAVALPNPIDHFVTECCGVEAYGRYMDDSYAIHVSKEHLQIVLGCIEVKAAELGIKLNRKKTHIVKLSHGFTFLKKKFSYGKNGRIVVQPCRDSITRTRRKMRKLADMEKRGEITPEQAARSYQSSRGSLQHYDAYRTIRALDAHYRDLRQNNPTGGVAHCHQRKDDSQRHGAYHGSSLEEGAAP